MDEKQVYLNSFEKWNIDFPYLDTAVSFYCINPTDKRQGSEERGQFCAGFMSAEWTNSKTTQFYT